MAECKFAGETDMIKIVAATNSDEFVEFGISRIKERLWRNLWSSSWSSLWSLPRWLKDNGFKTNHDFDGRGKLCNK